MSRVVPIYEVPSVVEKVARVKAYIAQMVPLKNFFGWRYFIDDLKIDIEAEIYKYEEPHLAGKPGYEKEQGVGAYCNMAMQGAINYSAMMDAQKRKINFIADSIDQLTETEHRTLSVQVPAKDDQQIAQLELLLSIQQEFGDSIYSLAQRVLSGETLSRKELAQLRKPELKSFLVDVD